MAEERSDLAILGPLYLITSIILLIRQGSLYLAPISISSQTHLPIGRKERRSSGNTSVLDEK
jgi:hypothetical protein